MKENYLFNHKNSRSLDETLGPIIVGGLKEYLKAMPEDEGKIDCGFCLPNEYKIKDIKKMDDAEYALKQKNALKEWRGVVEKMIYAFQDDEPYLPDGVVDMQYIDSKSATDNIKINIINEDRYLRYKHEYRNHYEKVSEGLELFSRHYRDLWW